MRVKCRINGELCCGRRKAKPRCVVCIPLLHGLGCRRDRLRSWLEVKLVGFTPSFVRFVTQGGRFVLPSRELSFWEDN